MRLDAVSMSSLPLSWTKATKTALDRIEIDPAVANVIIHREMLLELADVVYEVVEGRCSIVPI